MTSPNSTPEVDVVIVNWNGGTMIADCLAALDRLASELPPVKVIVVDNASSDGSAESLAMRNVPLQVIRNKVNLGFAGGCNAGAAAGAAPMILFLNPDVIVTSPDALKKPLAFLRESGNSSVGICGIQLRDEKGNVARTLSPFPTPWRSLGWMTGLDRILPRIFPPHFRPVRDHLFTQAVDSVMGAFLLMRRTLFTQLHGFSTRFFVYYEDVDLCKRASTAGFSSMFLHDVWVTHEGCGTTRNIRATRYFYSTRSRIIYGLRHFSPPAGYLTAIGWMTIDPIVRLLYAVVTLSPKGFTETLRGAVKLWSDSGNFMRERPA